MNPIILFDLTLEEKQAYANATNVNDNDLIVLALAFGLVFFFVGIMVGWVLHRKKREKDRRNRRSRRSNEYKTQLRDFTSK